MDKEYLKIYRRNYYRNKYNEDEEFKNKKKETCKNRYTRITKNCKNCGCRINKDTINNKCELCILKEFPQVKAKRGRHPKEIKQETKEILS